MNKDEAHIGTSDMIYLLYDMVEEIRTGVALAHATHGKYLDIDIYNNNKLMYSYTNMSRYEINNEHIILYSGEQYNVGVHDIINIADLTRLYDRFNKNEFRRFGGNYEKIGRMYTCRVYKTTGNRQLLFNKKLEILNSDFKEIENFTNYGALYSFVTNISDKRRMLGFGAEKVIMSSKTGKVLYTRKITVGLIDGEVVCSIDHVVRVLVVVIILGAAFIFKMIRNGG